MKVVLTESQLNLLFKKVICVDGEKISSTNKSDFMVEAILHEAIGAAACLICIQEGCKWPGNDNPEYSKMKKWNVSIYTDHEFRDVIISSDRDLDKVIREKYPNIRYWKDPREVK